jgi:aminopeptidase N
MKYIEQQQILSQLLVLKSVYESKVYSDYVLPFQRDSLNEAIKIASTYDVSQIEDHANSKVNMIMMTQREEAK